MNVGSAPGKIILIGEHAVVYGRPAIAAPVRSVNAEARLTIHDTGSTGQIWVKAPQINESRWLHEIPEGEPIGEAIQLLQSQILPNDHPPLHLTLDSTIPVSGGMGSSAAISLSILRAMAAHQGTTLSEDDQIAFAFETEILFHGTPSGIDNTVVALNHPIFFQRDQLPLPIRVPNPFQVLIADTGQPSQTVIAVAKVRDRFTQAPVECEAVFDDIEEIARRAKDSIEAGDLQSLGECFDENQEKLEQLRVSSAKLDDLISIARKAGALGAKLSGGGMGGNLVALVHPPSAESVRQAILAEGAVRVILTEVAL